MEWESIILEKRIKYTELVMESVLRKIPSRYRSINFVLLLDDFSPMQAIKHPRIGPSFLRSFIKSCPNDCMKTVVMVTGTTGHIFYNILKGLASKDFMKKVTVVKSRDVAASLLVEKEIARNKHEVPTFFGGNAVHDDDTTKSLKGMISTLL